MHLKNLLLFALAFAMINANATVIPVHSRVENDSLLLKKADSFYFAGQWTSAIPLYKTYLQHADNPTIWQRLGYSYQMSQHPADAEMAYRTSLEHTSAPFMKGYILMRMAETFAERSIEDSSLACINRAIDNGSIDFFSVDSSVAFASMRSKGKLTEVRQKLYVNAYPCMKEPHSSDFDFWVGEWDVYITGTKTLIGRSSIIKEDGGCTIMEHFTSVNLPASGHSINYYDLNTHSWIQLYVGSGGRGQLFSNGVYQDKAMRFTYSVDRGGKRLTGNFIFFDMGPDTCRQYNDISTDGGKTFKVNYDYTYVRRK
jgi:hypothetical protein